MRDYENLFDGALALTSSQSSTNSINLGPLHANNAKHQLGAKGQASLALQLTVGTAFTSSGSSTLVVALVTDDNSAFSSGATLFSTPSIAKASLAAGAKFVYPLPMAAYEDYAKLTYTVGTADFTGGTITAEIVMDTGDFYAYADSAPPSGY